MRNDELKYEAARFNHPTDAILEKVMENFDDADGEVMKALLELLERFAGWHLESNSRNQLNRIEFIEAVESLLSWLSERARNQSGAV